MPLAFQWVSLSLSLSISPWRGELINPAFEKSRAPIVKLITFYQLVCAILFATAYLTAPFSFAISWDIWRKARATGRALDQPLIGSVRQLHPIRCLIPGELCGSRDLWILILERFWHTAALAINSWLVYRRFKCNGPNDGLLRFCGKYREEHWISPSIHRPRNFAAALDFRLGLYLRSKSRRLAIISFSRAHYSALFK
jgi:hypothetical protein